ncbi:MAG: hypothetical protein AAGA21_12160 [Pseudomonadota bacterium]
MPMTKASRGRLTALTLAVSLGLSSTAVRAGIENPETGEQCWGQDCSDINDSSGASTSPGGGGGGYVTLPNVTTYDCTSDRTEMIDQSVRWLQNNLNLVDAQMGRNGLMDWPGNSEENFEEKLYKDLKIYCINDKNKCQNRVGLLGIVHPVVAQKRVNLCGQNIEANAAILGIDQQSLYVSTVAHEIGHLVRVNGHRNGCADRFRRPRFSQAVGLAAEAAHRGIDYDADDWFVTGCPTGTASSGAGGFDVIDNKLQAPPIQ